MSEGQGTGDMDRTRSATAFDAAARTGDAPAVTARPRRDARAWWRLAVWVLASVLAGTSVALIAPIDQAWYAALARPTWNPPSWVFGPVWTALYALIGVAAWLVAGEPGADPAERRGTWWVFGAQAMLNLAWSPLFFGLKSPGLAFVDICLLWIAVLWTTMRFGRIRPLAGYLLVPYVLWVSFALVLNGTIWLMND